MKAIVYARASGGDAEESLSKQTDQLLAWAAANGAEVVGEVKDTGSSLNHPHLDAVLAGDMEYDALIALTPDRISRSAAAMAKIRADLESKNRRLVVLRD